MKPTKALITIIPATINNQVVDAVSARTLYLGLGLGENNWTRWYKDNIVGNEFFMQAIDFTELLLMSSSACPNPPKDYAITIEFAKHLAMMARTKKSHLYRNYLLECERQVLEGVKGISLQQYQALDKGQEDLRLEIAKRPVLSKENLADLLREVGEDYFQEIITEVYQGLGVVKKEVSEDITLVAKASATIMQKVEEMDTDLDDLAYDNVTLKSLLKTERARYRKLKEKVAGLKIQLDQEILDLKTAWSEQTTVIKELAGRVIPTLPFEPGPYVTLESFMRKEGLDINDYPDLASTAGSRSEAYGWPVKVTYEAKGPAVKFHQEVLKHCLQPRLS